MAEKNILIICGEASGDLHAGNLAKALKELLPQVKIFGVGGQILAKYAKEIYCDIKELAVMGFFDVIKKLPKFFALKKLILEKIKTENFSAVILVDFSGFNLRLAKEINNKLPVIYYVSPQVWASRQRRVETIKKYISKMIVLFEFEKDFYRQRGITAELVGHPLLDVVKPTMEKDEFFKKFGLAGAKTTVALLPGSRGAEIKNILPVMLESAELLDKEIENIQFIVAKSLHVDAQIYAQIAKRHKTISLHIIEGLTYDCLNAADFSLVASGTATLETAIMQKPFCVIYKMGLLNYLLYRPQVKLPFIGMVNIVANKKIIPEFIQFNASAEKISAQAAKIIKNPSLSDAMKKDLASIKSRLGEKGAALRAAKIILENIK